VLDYFRNKDEIFSCGDMDCLERNYLDKHDSVNRTAIALTEKGLAFIAAWNLHRREGQVIPLCPPETMS
jgi:hypothetical protein